MENYTFLNVVDLKTKNLIKNSAITCIPNVYFYNYDKMQIYKYVDGLYKVFKEDLGKTLIIDINMMRVFIRKCEYNYKWVAVCIEIVINMYSISSEMYWMIPANIIPAPWTNVKVNMDENVADLSSIKYPESGELNYFLVNKCNPNPCCKDECKIKLFYYRVFFYRINRVSDQIKLMARIDNGDKIIPEYNIGFNIDGKYIKPIYSNVYTIRLDLRINKLAQIVTSPTPSIYLLRNETIADKWYISTTNFNLDSMHSNVPATSYSQSYFTSLYIENGSSIWFDIRELYDQLYNIEKMNVTITV